MPLPTSDVIGLMVDNLEKRDSVFPIPSGNAVKWARGLDIPYGGDTVIYTGTLYQLLPYIMAAVKNLQLFEESPLGKLVFIARFVNKFINMTAFMAWPSRKEMNAYNTLIKNIALLLKRANVQFGYLYEDELYSGALAYDMGADEVFEAHVKKVYEVLKKKKVKRLITIDPHTTNMLRSVYPKLLDGYELQVQSYLEVLAESDIQPRREVNKDVVVHDSCVYSRYEGVIQEPRLLLKKAGYQVHEPSDTKNLTHCCGGPIEAIFPSKAHEIGKKRVEQLKASKGQGVTMCPICLATLKKASNGDMEIVDISTLLADAFCQ